MFSIAKLCNNKNLWKGLRDYKRNQTNKIKLQMKPILFACLFAFALSTTVSSTALTWTVAYNAGTTSNATCALTGSFLATYGTMVVGPEYHGLWVSSTSAVTTASSTDASIFLAWTAAAPTTSTLTTTSFTTSPSAALYTSSGSAWTASTSSLTTNGSTITVGTAPTYTTAFTIYFPFTAMNQTSTNFTKSSLSWSYWILVSETAAYTQSSASWTGTATGTTSISISACTGAMALIKSGSLATSILSSFFALSFF